MHARAQHCSTVIRRCASGFIHCALAAALMVTAVGRSVGDPPSIRAGFGKPASTPGWTPPDNPSVIRFSTPLTGMELPVREPRPLITMERPAAVGDDDPPSEAQATVQPQPGGAESLSLGLRLTPPTPELLFRLEPEKALRKRIRQEAAANPKLPRPEFPPEEGAVETTVTPRNWPWYTRLVEPNFLCYGRLYFQQVPAERYGRDCGVMEPLVSAGIFYYDVLAVPLRAVCWPWRPYECSADNYSPFFEGYPRPH
jgi:hypothetical protein